MINAVERFFNDRRVLLALAFLVNAALGSGYSYGVFRPALEEHWALSAAASGLPYMIFLAAFAFSTPFGGALIERFGEKRTVWLGAALLGAGWLLAGTATDINSLALFYGLLGGAGVGIAYGAPLSLAAKLYPDRKGTAMGVALAGFGLSPLFSAPLIRAAIDLAGPVRAFAYSGAVLAAAVVLLSLFLRRPPAHPHAHTAAGLAALPSRDSTPVEMLRSPKLYALWLCFAAACAIGLSVVGITSSFAAEVPGLGPAAATALLMFFSVFNALGRPVFGWLADRLGPGTAGALSFFMVFCCAASFMAFPGSVFAFIAAFAGLWLNLGGWLAIAPAATAFFFGLAHHPRNYGLVYTAYGAGAIAGVTLTSHLRDLTGGYAAALPPIAVAALVFSVFSAFALRSDHPGRTRGGAHWARGGMLAKRLR